MQAIVQKGYGPPGRVLTFDEVDRPSVGDEDVLIRVRATSVNTPDWITVAGVPYVLRLRSGLRRPSTPVRTVPRGTILGLQVLDDGHGVPVLTGSGHGIIGMRERALLLTDTSRQGPAGSRLPGCRAPARREGAGVSIRVVVDDQALVRGGFAMVLNHQDDIDVVAEAGTGAEAIEAAHTHRPDVILMDIRMPELDGLEATSRIVEGADWPVRVLTLTTFDPDEYVYRALRAGASGFVLKDIPPEELPVAVRTVADGGALLAPSITTRLIG